MPTKKVAVLTPATDSVLVGYCMDLVHMVKHTMVTKPWVEVTVQSYGTSILPQGRQLLAQHALDQGATHTLWIDSDMRFPIDTILRLLAHKKPLVGANYMTRRAPWRCVAQRAPGEPITTTAESTGLEKVQRTGTGLLWVASEVYRKIGDPPWFDFEWLPDLGVFRGEDYYLFERTRQAGFQAYIDHDLSKEVRHVGSFEYHPLLQAAMEDETCSNASPESTE